MSEIIKTLYTDVETTGTDPRQHGLIQVACIVDIDGEFQSEANWHIRPFKGDLINMQASEVTGISIEEMREFPEPFEIKPEIERFFQKYVDKFDRADKFYVAGQNVGFDVDFIARWWEKCGDKYFGSYINWRRVDLLAWIDQLCWLGLISLPDRKLQTICDYLGVHLGDDAHDALADIRATRECILKTRERFGWNG